MTLEDINYIAQIVGVVAILGTFVALLVQMRQTNRLLRNQAKRAQIAELKSISEGLYQVPGLAEIMTRASVEGLEAVSLAERAQCFTFLLAAQRTWESMFVQYQDGLIDEALWQAHLRQARAVVNEITFYRQFWMIRRDFFMPEYRAFYEAEVLGQSGSDTLGYVDHGAASDSGAPPPAAAPGNEAAAT